MALMLLTAQHPAIADDVSTTREQILLLQQQNEQLRDQLKKQQEMIDSLARKVSEIQAGTVRQSQEIGSLKEEIKTEARPEVKESTTAPSDTALHLGKVDITGEGGLAFFKSQAGGQNPKGTFRIDEARLFVEAPVWQDVYFFSEIDLATRETTSLALAVGELYLDFEDVSRLWGHDKWLNVRVGQFYTPFGEEYLNRFAIDNPLISHSVSDIWGSDAGIELYGSMGQFQYAVAVQNGGSLTSHSLQDDKSVAARVGYDPTSWLHLSLSGMRTGNLNSDNGTSAAWFGNGFFRKLNSSSATTFHDNLVEGDVQLRLPNKLGQIRGAGGYINYGDSDPTKANHRDIYYYYVEGVHDFTDRLYTAARFSQVIAPGGYYITGSAPFYGSYLFGTPTTDYWRLSLGLGYHLSSKLLLKAEYSINEGREGNRDTRHENEFGLEAAFRF